MTQTNDGGATDMTTDASGQVRALVDRLQRLDHLCATAERRGPSRDGYVTDATYHYWCGERAALRDAISALTPAPHLSAATPTTQEAVPACKHLRTIHSRPGYDPLRPGVITCGDCGAVLSPDAHQPQPSVSVRSWEGRPFNDAWINEITMDALGQWPSFEAQSWACKVVHAVYAAHQPQPSVSVAEEMGGGDVIALVAPSDWDVEPQLAYARGWNAALRALKSGA